LQARGNLPKYQRGRVWKPAQKKRLVDSVFRGYPIPIMEKSAVGQFNLYYYPSESSEAATILVGRPILAAAGFQ